MSRRTSLRYIGLVGLALLVPVAVVGARLWIGSPRQDIPMATVPVAPPSWLSELAGSIASQNGDVSPTSALWGTTTAAAIAHSVGTTGGDPTQVEFVVIMNGRFTDTNAFVPAGSALPSGNEIEFTVDVNSHEVQDFEIGDRSEFDTTGLPAMQPFEPQVPSSPSPAA